MKAITAISGKNLRDYVNENSFHNNVSIFPEYGLSPLEQKDFVLNNIDKFETVITFSPYIISECQTLKIIDSEDFDYQSIKRGSSVNKIFNSIWSCGTIGSTVEQEFENFKESIETNSNEEHIDSVYIHLI